MDKAEPVDLQLAAGLLQHFPTDSLPGALTELDPSADGIVIIEILTAHHEQLSVFLNDRAHPDVHIAVRNGQRNILCHIVQF